MGAEGSSMIIMIVLMFAIMYFLKKGDTVTTIGGIVGKIVHVNKDTIVIETSDDRVRMELTKWAVSSVGVQTGEQPEEPKKEGKKEEKKDEAAETAQTVETAEEK